MSRPTYVHGATSSSVRYVRLAGFTCWLPKSRMRSGRSRAGARYVSTKSSILRYELACMVSGSALVAVQVRAVPAPRRVDDVVEPAGRRPLQRRGDPRWVGERGD